VFLCIQELEKARAIIAARLASKDGAVANPASAANSSSVDAMSLIAHGYVSDSEEEEGEIEYNKVKHMEKKAKLHSAAMVVEDASNQRLTTSLSQAVDNSVPDASASVLAGIQSADSHSQHRTEKSESRSSDDRKSHQNKDLKRDRRDRDRHELSKSNREKSREESSRRDRNKDSRRSGDEKVSKSQRETDQRSGHRSHEQETAKDFPEKSESEQRTSSKDSKVDRQHSSGSRETLRRRESDKTSEAEKRPSACRRSHSSPRLPSPDNRHRSAHSTDKKAER